MEWLQLASTYTPDNANAISAYDQFRMWTDHYRAYIIFVYLIIVYYLGFATRLRMPILKTIFLYVLLFIGALLFSILDVTLPVRSALFVAIIILVVVRFRITPQRLSRK